MQTKNPDDLQVKYLALKTNILTTKLKQTYANILIRVSADIQDQIVLKLDNWPGTHIYIYNGAKNEESAYVIYSDNLNLSYYGILSDNLNNQIEQILTIINFIDKKIIL